MPLATVIVLTYNSEPFIDSCFGSLETALAQRPEFSVLAVDNGSRDATVERLRSRFPFVEILQTHRNLGYAGGNNLGINRAFQQGAEYVYLLNPDTEVTAGFLDAAIEKAGGSLDTAAVQSLLLLDPERQLIDVTASRIHFLGFGFCPDHRRPLSEWDPSAVDEIPFASGAAVLLRCSALRRVGLLDETMYLYIEDLDLGWRLRLAGYRNVLAPASVVYHRHEFNRSTSKYFYLERNRYVTVAKNAASRTLLVLAPLFLVAEIGLAAAAVRGGWFLQKLRAWRELLRPSLAAHLWRERRRVQPLRTAPDRVLLQDFAAEVVFEGVAGPFTRRVINPLMTLAWRLARPLL